MGIVVQSISRADRAVTDALAEFGVATDPINAFP